MDNATLAGLTAVKTQSAALLTLVNAAAKYTAKTSISTIKANTLKTATAYAALKTGWAAFDAPPQPAPAPTPAPIPMPTPTPTPPANVVTVSTIAGLNAALKVATTGQTILLAPGTYSGLSASNLTLPDVTITSADRSNPATLTGFYLIGASGLTFTDLAFSTQGSTDPYPFRISGCSNISLTNLSVHGDLAGDPQAQMTGLWIGLGCSNITVTGCEFQKLANGLTHGNSAGITIKANRFHDIGTDAIDNGGSSNVTTSDNWISDLYPAPGQHPDGSQFFDPGVKTYSHDLTYTGNLIERGAGAAVQGITVGDEAQVGVVNVTIDGNTIIGCLYNGISVADGVNVIITNNAVIPYADQESWIVTRGCTQPVVLTGNTATKFAVDAGIDTSGNSVLVGPPADKGASDAAAWHAAHAGQSYGVRAK